MLDLYMRQLKEQLLAPFVLLFSFFHPNTITVASLFAGLTSAYYASYE